MRTPASTTAGATDTHPELVTVALPAIGGGIHLDRPTLTRVPTAYAVVSGGSTLLGVRLADLARPGRQHGFDGDTGLARCALEPRV
jgi:hypothetical protein